MRWILNLCDVALVLAVIAPSTLGQASRPAAGVQTRSADTRPAASQPTAFKAHAKLGPVTPAPEYKYTNRIEVYGPIWDGVNGGLWVVVQDWLFLYGQPEGVAQTRPIGPRDRIDVTRPTVVAVLIDPVTGQERNRLNVPNTYLLGHDGTGLWFHVSEPDNKRGPRIAFQRIRTAPGLTRQQQEHGLKLPEDMPDLIPESAFRVVSKRPTADLFSLFRVIWDSDHVSPDYLSQWYLLTNTINAYGTWGSREPNESQPAATGAGYLWINVSPLKRVALTDLEPISVISGPLAGWYPVDRQHVRSVFSQLEEVPADDTVPLARGWLTWDGEYLWSTTFKPGDVVPRRDSALTTQSGHSSNANRDVIAQAAPPRLLVRIDVGLSRKPDTTDRHNKALAFEKKNGTLKAIPLFEELIAYDPAAVEIRNHLAWALATRPQEPYHDIQRAKKLVEGALEWQPWNPEFWDTLAEIYWRLGDAKLAERLEAKAINLNPAKTFYWKQLDKFRAGPATQMAPEPAY